MEKGPKMEAKIHPKLTKWTKGEPQGRPNGSKNLQKGMPKTTLALGSVSGSFWAPFYKFLGAFWLHFGRDLEHFGSILGSHLKKNKTKQKQMLATICVICRSFRPRANSGLTRCRARCRPGADLSCLRQLSAPGLLR